MASIYRRNGRRKWYIAYKDPATQKRVVVPGYVDRDATRALATDMERIAARRAVGIEPPAPRDVTPSDYEASLLAAGCGAAWAKTCRQRIERYLKDGIATLEGLLPDTKRRYGQLIKAWCNFARVATPVLPSFSRRESGFVRRALTAVELASLLAVSPPDRATVYTVAAYTGLRRGELRRLMWRDVMPDRVTVYGKAGRVESVPLHPRVASALATRGEGRVFTSLPTRHTVRSDYVAAGVVDDGRAVDFHSLRYTFCTMLAKAGVNIWDAMKLMRHRDVRLTTKLYLDATQLDTDAAIRKIV